MQKNRQFRVPTKKLTLNTKSHGSKRPVSTCLRLNSTCKIGLSINAIIGEQYNIIVC